MNIITILIMTTTTIALMQLFLQGIFISKKYRIWFWIMIYVIYGCCHIALSMNPNFSIIRLIFNTVSVILVSFFMFQSTLLRAIYAGVSLSAIFVLSELISMTVFSLSGVNTEIMMSNSTERSIFVLSGQMVALLLILFVLVFTKRKRSAVTWPFILMLSPGIIISIIMGGLFYGMVERGQEVYALPFLIAAIGLSYMNILMVFYAERVKIATDLQRESELAEHHYLMQKQYYNQIQSEQEETRALFHDINKYMNAMRAIAGENNQQVTGEVLEEVQNLMNGLNVVVDVGNPIINVILNEYKQKAEKSEIDFRFNVEIPPDLKVTVSDAYIIMGNTIDNAIEACLLLPQENRYIELKLTKINDMLLYQVSNPYLSSHRSRTKGKGHGYGLRNVERCVKKYNGVVTISDENGIFTFTVVINKS